MISDERIIARIASAEQGLDTYYRKAHRLRRLVAGDHSALNDGDVAGTNIDDASQVARPNRTDLDDILVTHFEEGRDNGLLKALRTLVLQTSYYFPDIQFHDMEAYESAVNKAYLKRRMREKPFGCNARHHGRLSLFDYCTGGMGWGYVPMVEGTPQMQYADTLDVLFDQTARIPQDIAWAGVTRCRPMSYWARVFPQRKLSKYWQPGKQDPHQDSPFELFFYYDTEEGPGNYGVYAKLGANSYDPEPIMRGKNPCFFDFDNKRTPFLPFECMFFMALPSVRLPVGVAENMMPEQIATWRVDRIIYDIMDRGAPFYEVAQGAFVDEKQQKTFEAGEVGGYVVTKSGNQINQKPAAVIPRDHIQYRNEKSQGIIEQSGADPFAVGDQVKGVNFAAQVNAIKNSAGLMAGNIAKDNAEWWERMIRKFLAKGKAYDRQPITLKVDGVDLVFDAADPINEYLRPDADITVREETMKFRSRMEEIKEAEFLLEQSLKVQQQYPAAVGKAFEHLLETMGYELPEKWMGQPAMPPGQPPGTGMPGMVPPVTAPL